MIRRPSKNSKLPAKAAKSATTKKKSKIAAEVNSRAVTRVKEAKPMAVATARPAVCVTDQIGETAGAVWHYLNDHGSTSITKLIKELEPNRDLVMQAVGWLAREDKVALEDEGKTRIVRLRD